MTELPPTPLSTAPTRLTAKLNPFAGAWDYLQIFRRRMGRRLYLVFLLSLLAGGVEGIGIALLLPLLTTPDLGIGSAGSVPEPLAWIVDALGVSGSLTGILFLIGGTFLLKGVVVFGTRAYSGYLSVQLMRELREKVFDACSQMSYGYYTSRNTGHFVNVTATQVNGFVGAFGSYVSFLTRILQATIYVLFSLLLAWRFGVMVIILGVVALALFARLNRYVRRLSRGISTEASYLNKLLVQSLQAFKYLTSTHEMGRLRSAVHQSNRRLTGYRLRQQIWGSFSGTIGEPISITLIIGITIVQVGVLNRPFAPILVSIFLFYRGMGQMLQVQGIWQSTLNQIGSVEMVETELAALEAHRERGGGRIIGPLNEQIELEHVSFAYKPELGNALTNLTFTVPARSTVAFVGESGAGKSTLIDLLTLLLKPQTGSVRIDGHPGHEIELSSWRRQIGYVSQETVVFDDSIAANIALADIDCREDEDILARVRAAAAKAHLDPFIETLPEGYTTPVGDRGIRLSGGQRQRLFIARELYKNPKLLILDEATSALDSESERAIQASIDALRGHMTVVIIAHRLSTIRNVDRVFVLSRGRLVEQGTYKELSMADESRFGSMVALQAI